MRCPKCHYVSFDGQNRCRNCGYDLSLAQLAVADTVDLPTRTETTATPLADLSLKGDPPSTGTDTPTLVDRYLPQEPATTGASGQTTGAGIARAPARGGASAESDPLDLPLFGPGPPGSVPAAPPLPPQRPPATESVSETSTAPIRVPAASRSAAVPPATSAPRPPADDRPLVSGVAPPRPPLSVRRPTGDVPRARRVTPQPMPAPIDEPRLDLGVPEPTGQPDLDDVDLLAPAQPRDIAARIAASRAAVSRTGLAREGVDVAARDARTRQEVSSATAAAPSHDASRSSAADAVIDEGLAPLGTRIAAGLIDLAFMLAVDAVVLYFTLRVLGLPFSAWRRLPMTPLALFLGLLNGGYLTMFTAASGQTMGKMAFGVRVVTSDGTPVSFGSAAVRAVLWLLTIVPAGIGFIPAILANDRRALYDRFADTKVIKTTD
jgi:uncharacterized RDD family membrane protein YckC